MIRTALLVVLLIPVPGSAAPVRDLGALVVPPAALIYVEHASGQESVGRFVRASRVELVIDVQGTQRVIEGGDVRRVWVRGDRLRNGALIGAAIGLLGGVFGQSTCTDCGSAVVTGVVIGVPLWAAIGAWVDAEHVGRTLVYRAPLRGP